MEAISNLTNPWRCPKDRLYSLASGAPVSADIEHDVLNADEIGKKRKLEFLQERLKDGVSAIV